MFSKLLIYINNILTFKINNIKINLKTFYKYNFFKYYIINTK